MKTLLLEEWYAPSASIGSTHSLARIFNTHIGVRVSNYNHLEAAEYATMPKHWSLA